MPSLQVVALQVETSSNGGGFRGRMNEAVSRNGACLTGYLGALVYPNCYIRDVKDIAAFWKNHFPEALPIHEPASTMKDISFVLLEACSRSAQGLRLGDLGFRILRFKI